MTERIFGHVPGYPEGSCFASRLELSQAGVHRPRVAGISGRGREGADSVVLAGGYEDTQDYGDEILYTGHGGRDPETAKQVGHQDLTRGNLALATNKLLGLPVRVIRGARHYPPYSPAVGYRYDGLYAVDDCWRERGRSGFRIWRFRLIKLPKEQKSDLATAHPGATSLRLVHETEPTRQLKALYHYRCQMCGRRLATPAGPYAEAVYIRPLGVPHNGSDTPDNLLCLCPNHHVLFALGSVAIADDFTLLGQDGRLRVDFRHHLNKKHLRYHREHYWVGPEE
ncbi:MAG TPA: YDG/SRA domain-containing protein [Candidatus Binatia bacterium]|jgi:putative restriction endonuclease|nr:YDG/SRA domain-containing protein [Candidatus Binatia bacterium]